MKSSPPEAIGRLVAARAWKAMADALRAHPLVTASGLWGSSPAAVTAALEKQLGRPTLVICGHIDEADDIADDMELFHGRRPDVLPALELSGSLGRASEEAVAERLEVVVRYARYRSDGPATVDPVQSPKGPHPSPLPQVGEGARAADRPTHPHPNPLPEEEGAGHPVTPSPRHPHTPLLVAPIHALMQSVPSHQQMRHLVRTLRPSDALEIEKLIVWLSEHGYNRLEQVEVPGDFAVRGGIIDIYLPGEFEQAGEELGLCVRIDFMGDQVESIRTFDLSTLGSKEELKEVRLLDLKGQLPESGESTNFLSYLPDDALIVLWQPLEIAEQARSYLDRLSDLRGMYPLEAVLQQAGRFARLELSQFGQGAVTGEVAGGQGSVVSSTGIPACAQVGSQQSAVGSDQSNLKVELQTSAHFTLPIRSLQKFETDARKAVKELAELAATHDVAVFCDNAGEIARFGELLDQNAPGLRGTIQLGLGYLHRGFVWEDDEAAEGRRGDSAVVDATRSPKGPHPSPLPQVGEGARAADTPTRPQPSPLSRRAAGEGVGRPDTPSHRHTETPPSSRPLAFLGHHELFNRFEVRRRMKKVIQSRPVDSFLDLKVGDYVVHVAHGIAKFTGIQTMNRDGRSEEYLTLRFAENAALHVPANRINLIQKYIGGFHGHPQLSRLGSGQWEKQKAKVSEAVMDMAAELLEIQAARAAETGLSYPPDTQWQKEFEAEFPYEPTPDQITGATDIKNDMQQTRPMDRLLCGDVGYGKTELAMRAAFKAIEFGKQVAVLVPTTVLAEQHYRSFRDRMAEYPFVIESISRFKTGRQQKDILRRLGAGEVDILIGTHRLVSKDVRFADLGLVVVDEEQRFGVTHKERLKQMRKTVDVLTMSATPIPRTLHMSLLGLRDISSLTTAPQDRRSVVTEIAPYDPQRVKLAIERELAREGQVYFVHNRVHNIQETADRVQQLVPTARVIIGHGQMPEHELEEVMLKFIRHEADILVCTTIIESGLDIPNANTIFINQADRFGLSELHQLRGRVGRWKHRAYCYLLLPTDRPVTPTAAKRLKAIEEYSHLGAGFKIAMRDLEIRGAGNILGPEQSGHIAAVGYEMYCQLLEDAVRQLKDQPRPVRPEAHVEIGISAFVPRAYIADDRQRLDVYRRIARCASMDELAQVQRDIADAYGDTPRQVLLLFAMMEVRLLSGLFGIEKIIKQPPDVVLTLRDAARAQGALAGAPGTLRIVDSSTLYFRPPATHLEPEPLLMTLRNLMKAAYEREQRGESHPVAPARPAPAKPAPPPKPRSSQLAQLESLRDAGVLTEAEYAKALERLAEKK